MSFIFCIIMYKLGTDHHAFCDFKIMIYLIIYPVVQKEAGVTLLKRKLDKCGFLIRLKEKSLFEDTDFPDRFSRTYEHFWNHQRKLIFISTLAKTKISMSLLLLFRFLFSSLYRFLDLKKKGREMHFLFECQTEV